MRLSPSRRLLTLCVLSLAPVASVGAQTLPSYLKDIVLTHAPIILQETDNVANPNEALRNHVLRVDFDGDFDATNNSLNATQQNYLKRSPTVYYSIVETLDAYYIGYYLYHVVDGGQQLAGYAFPGHEHDMEGLWMVVEKDWEPEGRLVATLTEAHGALLPFLNMETGVGGVPTAPGGNVIHWYDSWGFRRPVVAVRRSTHGTYMAQDVNMWCTSAGVDASQAYACIHTDASAIFYYPLPYGCELPAGCSTPVPVDGISGAYYYDLKEIRDSDAIWLQKENLPMFVGDLTGIGGGMVARFYFASSNGVRKANPPWDWESGTGICFQFSVISFDGCWYSFDYDNTMFTNAPRAWPTIPVGALFTNPAAASNPYFYWRLWTWQSVYNPFVMQGPDPLSASISGPDMLTRTDNCGEWTASVSGGTPPYTIQWSGAFAGEGSTVSGCADQSGDLYLDVWDANGEYFPTSTSFTFLDCDGDDCGWTRKGQSVGFGHARRP